MDTVRIPVTGLASGEHPQQLLRISRLRQHFESVAVAAGPIEQFRGRDLARKQNHTYLWQLALKTQSNVDTVDVGQIDIAEENVRLERGSDGECFVPIPGATNIVAVLLQDEFQSVKHDGFVFHDQDLWMIVSHKVGPVTKNDRDSLCEGGKG